MGDGKWLPRSGRSPTTIPDQGSFPPISRGSTLLEHSIIELRNDWGGWPKGARGTIVSEHETCALVEFSGEEGEALGFGDIPYGALRRLDKETRGRVSPPSSSRPVSG